MITRVLTWGNSLALRIPIAFARELDISENSTVNLSSVDGRINIDPIPKIYHYDLDELINQVNENNLHGEYDTGKPRGKEI